MLIVTIGLLGWGTYTFLTSLHILDLVQGTVDKTIWTAGGAVIGGAVLAFFTVIVSFAAVARAKPKTAALTLMLGAFFLPLGACAAGVHYGWPVLKENTLTEARQIAGTVTRMTSMPSLARSRTWGSTSPGAGSSWRSSEESRSKRYGKLVRTAVGSG